MWVKSQLVHGSCGYFRSCLYAGTLCVLVQNVGGRHRLRFASTGCGRLSRVGLQTSIAQPRFAFYATVCRLHCATVVLTTGCVRAAAENLSFRTAMNTVWGAVVELLRYWHRLQQGCSPETERREDAENKSKGRLTSGTAICQMSSSLGAASSPQHFWDPCIVCRRSSSPEFTACSLRDLAVEAGHGHSPDIRNVCTLEVLRNRTLQMDIYLLTYLH